MEALAPSSHVDTTTTSDFGRSDKTDEGADAADAADADGRVLPGWRKKAHVVFASFLTSCAPVFLYPTYNIRGRAYFNVR